MLEVTTIGSHAGIQALGEVCHCFVDVLLWQLFPDTHIPFEILKNNNFPKVV